MKVPEYYMTLLQELSEGTRKPPEGISLSQQEPLPRAIELQQQIQGMGLPEFLRRCAAQDGTELDEDELEALKPENLLAALARDPAPTQTPPEALEDLEGPKEPDPPVIEEPDDPRSVYSVLLDCCSLDEDLLRYLIDVLQRNADKEFQKLALVTTRKAFPPEALLEWLAGLESRATREELICSAVMDACLDRLASEDQKELMAALLSGDRKTFELFRCDAPELVHLPQATFEWYAENYLDHYYPIRYLIRFNGIRLARANFETGCNCAQAVLCAYPELLPREMAMKLGASLGGGIGRLREVCGAVSTMVLLAGLLYADTDIPTHERKQAHYARVQELAHRFQSAHGSYLCRDLLAGVETTPGGAPEARTAQYYAKRPCAGLCESAAALFDAYVQENSPEKQP